MSEKHPKGRRWFQFRLWTLLAAVLVLSLPLSWFAMRMERARKQREAVEAIEKAGGHTGFSLNDLIARSSTRKPERTWLRGLLGDDFFDPVLQAYMSTNTSNDDLEHLKALPRLRILDLRDTQITDVGLKHLCELRGLKFLWIHNTQVTPEGVKELREALPDCEIEY